MLSGDEINPNPNSAVAGDATGPETTTTGGTTTTSTNKLPAGSGPGTTGRTSLDSPTTRTSMAMPGELHPQAAGTHPPSSGDYPSGQPTSNPGTTTGKSGAAAAAASPFAVGAGLTGTASTGGTTTTKKHGNGLFGVRSSKEVPRTTPAGSQPISEAVADGRPATDLNLDRSNQGTWPSTGPGVVPARKGSDMYDSEGTHRRGLFGTGTATGTGTGASKHHLHSGPTTSGVFSLTFCASLVVTFFWDVVAVHEPHHLGRIVDLPQDAKDIEQITDELHRMFSFGHFFAPSLILLSTAVTHELVRCIETEEVSRVQEHERHSKFIVSTNTIEMNISIAVHHIQHHMQPIIAREELPEEHTDHVSI